MLVTQRYYVLLENPIRLDIPRLITGYVPKRASFAECLKYRPDLPARVHLIPRPGAGAEAGGLRSFELPAMFSFHHINAFEVPPSPSSSSSDERERGSGTPSGAGGQQQGNGQGQGQGGLVAIDTVALLAGVDFAASMETVGPSYYTDEEGVGRGYAVRLLLDLETGKVVQRKLLSRSCEFPAVNPSVVGRPYSVAYMTCDNIDHPVWFAPPQALAKLVLQPSDTALPGETSCEVWSPGALCFAQEPMFVPRRGGSGAEDDGWVLAFVYDAERRGTDLVVIDAARFAQGPVATVHLPFSLPYGLHGFWAPEVLGPDPQQPPAASSYDIRNGVANSDGSFKYA